MKELKDEPTAHLMWFVERGFHQMKKRREEAKEELARRGINIKTLEPHRCFCKQCKSKE